MVQEKKQTVLSGFEAYQGDRTLKTFSLAAMLFISTNAFASQVSWYSAEACKFNKVISCPTASGKSLHQLINDEVPYVAMWEIPFGTKIKFTNPKNGLSTVGIVFDRGPARRLRRDADVSPIIFDRLGISRKQGLAQLEIEVMP